MPSTIPEADAEGIAQRILIVRGQRVLLDSDLAELYGVSTARLNQQVRRNRSRFPADFMFLCKSNELRGNLLHFATGSQKHRDPRRPPTAFTEHGAIMAATVLSSPRAVEMSVYVVRAFIKLRQILASNADLARKQFEDVYGAIRALMKPVVSTSRPIGFTADLD